MGFQDTAVSLRSRLHLGRISPAVVTGIVVIGVLVVCCVAFGLYQASTLSHDLVVEQGASAEGESPAPDSPVSSDAAGQTGGEEAPAAVARVHVAGCVNTPGVYDLPEGARVADAVEAAGGFSEDAAPDALNLARVVADGEQVLVPSAEAATPQAVPPAQSAAGGQPSLININTADATLLQELDGVGEATAEKIIAEREANGPFASVEDIQRVSGIGEKRFEAIKDRICV